MTPSRDIGRLVEIMRALRDPEIGCPWDVEQTPASIVPYTIEEVYEVVDAIERGDAVDLREELGDLLLQVVYHAQFAAERGAFDFGDVVEDITRKMIRRHPHVFGDERARDAGAAKGAWERIKAEEKAERAEARRAAGLPSPEAGVRLDKVPRAMPPLMEALKIQREMAKVGFDWEHPEPVLDKAREELGEIEEAIASGEANAIADEIGDLLFVAVNLARLTGVDPMVALRGTNAKVRRRFAGVERAIEAEGGTLEGATLERMDAAWDAAKADEHSDGGVEPSDDALGRDQSSGS